MDELDYKKVGKKMKELRSSLGITQERVAKDRGCTIAFVSNVENNRVKINLRVLYYYSKLCNVSVDTFLNAGRPDPVGDTDEAARLDELQQLFRSVPQEQQQKVLEVMRLLQQMTMPTAEETE